MNLKTQKIIIFDRKKNWNKNDVIEMNYFFWILKKFTEVWPESHMGLTVKSTINFFFFL